MKEYLKIMFNDLLKFGCKKFNKIAFIIIYIFINDT